MVRVILKSNEADNLSYHKRNLTKTKRYVLCFLQKLYQFGYRHFVIYINDPIDFWLAEMLYFMHYCKKYADVVYSLINLEIHIYETKPKTTPTRFNKISSISKTPTLSSCCASSAAHIAKKAMPIIALLFFIFQDKKNENGANSKTLKIILLKKYKSCVAILISIALIVDTNGVKLG